MKSPPMNSEITFLIPVYNAEAFLPECLSSLLGQSDPSWKAVIVDDGSTDSSPAILENCTDSRITVIRQPNAGPAAARKTALNAVGSGYVLFLDADDYLSVEAVRVLNQASRSGEDIIVFTAQKVKGGELGHFVKDPLAETSAAYSDAIFTRKAHGCLWNKLFRRDLFGEDIMYPRYGYGEDRVMCIQLARKARSLKFVDDVLYYYRKDNPSGLTKRRRRSRKLMEARNYMDLGKWTGERKYMAKGAWLAFLYGREALRDYRNEIKGLGGIDTLPARLYLRLTSN